MTFIIILLCLFTERYFLELEEYRQPAWFHRYLTWSRQLPWGEWMSQSISGVLIILAPLLIAVGLLQALFDDILGGIPELLFASAVLLLCLGPKDLQRQIQLLIDALDTGDEEGAQRIEDELTAAANVDEVTDSQPIGISILKQAYVRTFSVIFWFVILGPIGAILYRASYTLRQTMPEMKDLGIDFRSGINRLLYILDWVPVRITAFTFALSGNFHNATYGWWNSDNDDENKDAESILNEAGRGALGINDTTHSQDDPAMDVEVAQSLTLRSLTIWVGLLALISITSWLS